MPSITETELKKQIKSAEFSPAYVLYGEEQMYVSSYTDKLINAVAGKSPSDFNMHTFSGDFDLDDFAASLNIVPFMSKYNCVVVKDLPFDDWQKESGGKDKLKRFKELTSKPYDGTVLIVSMPTHKTATGKGQKKYDDFLAAVKQTDKFASLICFDRLSQTAIEKQIGKWASDNGKLISRINAARLISICGDDLTLLHNEVNKICAYESGEEITAEDIDKLACVTLEAQIFSLGEAVIKCDGQRAFNILETLFFKQEDPNAVFYILAMNYIDAYRMRAASECGIKADEAAKDFSYGKRKFALEKNGRLTSRLSTEALRKSLNVLVETDSQLKSSRTDGRLPVEQAIARLLIISKEGKR